MAETAGSVALAAAAAIEAQGYSGLWVASRLLASRQTRLCTGRYWPVRTYSWGTVPALASHHSDLPLLVRLLLELGLEPLKQGTEERYHRYRYAAAQMQVKGKDELSCTVGLPLLGLVRSSLLAVGGLLGLCLSSCEEECSWDCLHLPASDKGQILPPSGGMCSAASSKQVYNIA